MNRVTGATLTALATALSGLMTSNTVFAENESWTDRVEISGVVEFEAFTADSDSASEEDADLATFELGLDAAITDSLEAYALILAEGPDHDVELDEAGLVIGLGTVSVNLGKQYVPFGNFESHMISDPLTLEIGETNASAATLEFEAGPVEGSVFVFNGDVDETGSDSAVDNYGLSIGVGGEQGGFSYSIGLSTINSIADTDGLEENFEEGVAEYAAGTGGYLILGAGPVTFIAEYVAANDPLFIEEARLEPEAFNLELGYNFSLAGKDATVAIATQGTDEAAALGLPETRNLLSVSSEVMPSLTVALEFARDEDYSEEDGGSGEETDVITLLVAIEF